MRHHPSLPQSAPVCLSSPQSTQVCLNPPQSASVRLSPPQSASVRPSLPQSASVRPHMVTARTEPQAKKALVCFSTNTRIDHKPLVSPPPSTPTLACQLNVDQETVVDVLSVSLSPFALTKSEPSKRRLSFHPTFYYPIRLLTFSSELVRHCCTTS